MCVFLWQDNPSSNKKLKKKKKKKSRERIRKKNIIHYKTKEWNRIIGNDWFNTKHNDFRINCFLGVSNKSGFCILYSFFFGECFCCSVSVCCCGMSTQSLSHSLTQSPCVVVTKKKKETSNLFVHIFVNNELCLYSFNYFWMMSILEAIGMVTHYTLNGANIFAYFGFNGNFNALTFVSQVGNFLLCQFFKGF